MLSRTLGGDRLGSGKKNQVYMHGYERSTHDLSYVWRSTMAAGTLVPFMSRLMLPGDDWDIELFDDVMTLPTTGPLFGSMKVQMDVFQVPIRLYNAALHNNQLEIGLNMQQIKLPQISFDVYPIPSDVQDIDNCQVNPSCLLSYLGIRGFGDPGANANVRTFNATSILGYWDIVKNYYSNKQERIGAVIHATIVAGGQTIDTVEIAQTSGGAEVMQAPDMTIGLTIQEGATIVISYTGTEPDWDSVFIQFGNVGGYASVNGLTNGSYVSGGGVLTGNIDAIYVGYTVDSWRYLTATEPIQLKPNVVTFDLANIDQMRTNILAHPITTPFEVNDQDDLYPYLYLVEHPGDMPNILFSQEGLALKTYNSDIFNNWLESEFIEAITTASAVSTAGDSFTIDQLNLAKKVYDMLNRIAVSGGTYSDWIDTVWGIESRRRSETPMYMGGKISELIFQEINSTAAVKDEPLGTLAGKGKLSGNKKGGFINLKTDEPSYAIGIVSITPRIDYSQGNEWDVNLESLDDIHKPALDQIGFQDLITDRMAWWDTTHNGTSWVFKSAGKQPAWLEYMTAVNRTYGNFAIADNQMFMTLNRRYEYEEGTGIKDLTTYIDPSKYNFIFAEETLDAQNYWVQIGVKITARRKMSAKIMPNL